MILPTGWSAEVGQGRTVSFRERQTRRYVIESPNLGTNLSALARSDWTQARRENGPTNIVELGSRLVLEIVPGAHLNALLANENLTVARTIRSNLFILQASDSSAAIKIAEALAVRNDVITAVPVMRRPFKFHNRYSAAPNDTLFTNQWHLENRGPDGNLTGPDLDVRAAWPLTRGTNILIAVADDGVDLNHLDLTNRLSGEPHFDFFEGTTNGAPFLTDANHGTAVAGLIGAEGGNSRGIIGVAPQARLASWVIWGTSFGVEKFASDEQLMDMFQYASNRVAVQNHSWGNASEVQEPIEPLSDSAIENAVTLGRDSKGVVLVRAAGNGRAILANANDDGFANDPREIAVAALRKDGRACSYSSPGACILVAAPSGDELDSDGDGQPDSPDPDAPGIYTTDRAGTFGYNTRVGQDGDYFDDFNGTSASSPQIAGVAGLIVSANSNLTWRDVQQVLVLSARHYDFADPDLKTNGAGFRFSHNAGFGVPDAGAATELARSWSNRPPHSRLSFTNSTSTTIPDDSLRVLCSGEGLASTLTNIRCMPSFGPHPDDATAQLPLVYVGLADKELDIDLHGKAALIQRGTSFFFEKIERAARAGAAFAIIFNNTGTTAIQEMGGTDYVPIPAVSIGRSNGEALRDFIASSTATAKLQLTPASSEFNVTETMLCEHVGVRLKTTHSSRQDVRVTLVSPMGTRSVFQAINVDDSEGPSDWTYWSTANFFESSAGTWRLEVSDERNTSIRTSPFISVPAIGALTYAELIILGVPILDSDRDGLDDAWEQCYFGNLNSGPKDDPDGDGLSNAREQIMGTNPAQNQSTFTLDVAQLKPGYLRLSWLAQENLTYAVSAANSLSRFWTALIERTGSFSVGEFVVRTNTEHSFFRIQRKAAERGN